jgi:hydroxyacylglutathione hydrolase
MYQVIAIPAFTDNYLWALVNNEGYCAIVDPGDALPVIEFLDKHNYTLTDILLTHHHSDHIGGVDALLKKYTNINVYGPSTSRFTMVNNPCTDKENILLTKLNIKLTVMEVPGHTIDHICYFDDDNVFLGDTLFSAGCGRLFEGTPEQMHHSLTKISQLNNNTNIYCAHEYTLANITFALNVDPDNQDLIDYDLFTKQQRANNMSTIPTKLSTQLAINPFLRSSDTQIKQAIKAKFDLTNSISDQTCFTYLRKWKDSF